MDKLLFPECAVCNKPVEKVQTYRNEIKNCHEFVVWCHGEMETTELDDSVLKLSNKIRIGKAFRNRQITPPRERESHEV